MANAFDLLVTTHPVEYDEVEMGYLYLEEATPEEKGEHPFEISFMPKLGKAKFELQTEDVSSKELLNTALDLIIANAPPFVFNPLNVPNLREQYEPMNLGDIEQSINRKLVSRLRNAQNYVAVDGRVGPARFIIANPFVVQRLEEFITDGQLSAMLVIAYDGIPKEKVVIGRLTEHTLVLAVNKDDEFKYKLDFVNREVAAKQATTINIVW